MTDALTFRLASTGDREAILALRRKCFPGEDVEKLDPRFWDWQFLAGRGLAFLAEEDGRPVAHFALLRQTYMMGGAPVPTVMAVDAMTDPRERARGVYTRLHAFAMRHAETRFRVGTAFQIRALALSPLLRNGWAEQFRIPVLVRPVSVMSLVRRPSTPEGSVVEGSAEELASVASAFFGAEHIRQDRTAEYVAWRYLGSPVWKYDIRVARTNGKAVAYCVTRRTVLKGFSTLAVVDIAWKPGHRLDARGILREALRKAHTQLAAALITSTHPAFGLLVRAGFLPGPYRFRFLVRPFGAIPSGDQRWALMWGDTDHL